MYDSRQIADFVRTRGMAAALSPLPATPPVPVGADLRISIVMPSYQQARFIERSLNSLVNQDHASTEIIVVDGGSTDGTREILERYSDAIASWSSARDRGQSDALNTGFARATGEVFGWLNSDDLYLPGALRAVAAVFATHPEVEFVYGDYYTVDGDERIVEHCHALKYSRNRLVTEGFFCHPQSMFWRRSLHERVGEFDLDLHYAMDYDFMLRMSSAAPPRAFHRIDRPLGCFRLHPAQKTGTVSDQVNGERFRIADRSRVRWKFGPWGRAMRLYYRATRVTEHLMAGRHDYLLGRLRRRFQRPASV